MSQSSRGCESLPVPYELLSADDAAGFERMLMALQEIHFRTDVRMFIKDNCAAFTKVEPEIASGMGYSHLCYDLHKQYKELFEARIDAFLAQEGISHGNFMMLARTLARAAPAYRKGWDAFIAEITASEDFVRFTDIMRVAALQQRVAEEEAARSIELHELPRADESIDGYQHVLKAFEEIHFRTELRAFIASHCMSFADAAAEHASGAGYRHECLQLHNEYRVMFDRRLEEFLTTEGVPQAEFLNVVQTLSARPAGASKDWEDFIHALTASEDYSRYADLMCRAAEEQRAKLETSARTVELSVLGQHQPDSAQAHLLRYLESGSYIDRSGI